MKDELELWCFVKERLSAGFAVELLVVAESSGSSPGRAGFKMAVSDAAIFGSIGGGVMEVRLVEEARARLSGRRGASVSKEVHREDSADSSGMICSGEQTVVSERLGAEDLGTVQAIIESFGKRERIGLSITEKGISLSGGPESGPHFSAKPEGAFEYFETLGAANRLFIVGGGHCALALSSVMSGLGFRITLFDDRADLNTLEKNVYADEIILLESYEGIADHVPAGDDVYVVVMTIGYKYDDLVIRRLLGRTFRYFGVLGSKAKMAKLLRELRSDGLPEEEISKIRTPIGISINSRTPEEIAISIAAEIIAVKNSK